MGLGCVLSEYGDTFLCTFCCLFSAPEFKKTLNKLGSVKYYTYLYKEFKTYQL